MIKNLKEAFEILEEKTNGIPFDAIDYVYNHKTDKTIEDKIISNITNCYNIELLYDYEPDFPVNAPLWYAIIAEKHYSEKLIKPVLNLFKQTEDSWDFMDEQGMFLVGLLCEKYPQIIIPKIIDIIDELSDYDTNLPYLYLFDFLYYIDINIHKKRVLQILSKDIFIWYEPFAIHVAEIQLKEALPILQKKLKELKELDNQMIINHTIIEIEEAIKILESGENKYSEQLKPYYISRGYWKTHYKNLNDMFIEEELKTINNNKIRRNDLCPCGSGKKFKKCCIGKGLFD